jgi:hypothetical protein
MGRWRVVAAAVMLLLPGACSLPAIGSTQYNPIHAALASWKDYPADHDPRPIVWLKNTSPAKGFSTDAAWVSAACGFFTRDAPLPTEYETYGVVTHLDGTQDTYLNVSAGEALWALTHKAGVKASDCGSATPMVISGVRFGTFAFDTDRGKQEMPAWLFTVSGAASELAYPAITSTAFWRGGLIADARQQAVNFSDDGRSLTMTFTGASGGCAATYQGVVGESASAVAIWLQVTSTYREVCPSITGEQSVTMTLASPLGGRVVVDEYGNAMAACPATFVGGC